MRLLNAVLASLFLLSSVSSFALGDGKLHMYFVDCGQGDAILLVGPQGTSVLVDGGPSNTVTPITEAMNDAIAAGLTDNRLDYVVCSHMHSDHLHGLEIVAAQFAGGLVYVYSPRGGLNVYDATTGRRAATLACGPGHWNSPIVLQGKIILPEGNANDHATSGVLDIWSLPGSR